MIEINGKYSNATIYADSIEESSRKQIQNFVNHPSSQDCNIKIMPDVHTGKGSVIGLTTNLTQRVVPNIIGVDIGCGVSAWNLGKVIPTFPEVDTIVRESVPSGFNVRETIFDAQDLFKTINLENKGIADYEDFMNKVTNMEAIPKTSVDRVLKSLGTLGGGNHFIEIGKDDVGDHWLIIHSGSRSFGLKIAQYHQKIAEELVRPMVSDKQIDLKKIVQDAKKSGKNAEIPELVRKARETMTAQRWQPSGLEYLTDIDRENYFIDMKIAQVYATVNRYVMGYNIINGLNLKFGELEFIESIHNYINFDDGILRKGAISAHKNEKLLIPLNMAEGTILGLGKGNSDWNFSAAHGAGRKYSRRQANKKIDLADFKAAMKDVWSSCVSEDTIDEAPQAYKNSDDIIKYIVETVDIITILKPVYNYKAN